jgi:hypothetical protein
MVAFHKELRVQPTIAAESMFRNKISTAWRSVLKTISHDLADYSLSLEIPEEVPNRQAPHRQTVVPLHKQFRPLLE